MTGISLRNVFFLSAVLFLGSFNQISFAQVKEIKMGGLFILTNPQELVPYLKDQLKVATQDRQGPTLFPSVQATLHLNVDPDASFADTIDQIEISDFKIRAWPFSNAPFSQNTAYLAEAGYGDQPFGEESQPIPSDLTSFLTEFIRLTSKKRNVNREGKPPEELYGQITHYQRGGNLRCCSGNQYKPSILSLLNRWGYASARIGYYTGDIRTLVGSDGQIYSRRTFIFIELGLVPYNTFRLDAQTRMPLALTNAVEERQVEVPPPYERALVVEEENKNASQARPRENPSRLSGIFSAPSGYEKVGSNER